MATSTSLAQISDADELPQALPARVELPAPPRVPLPPPGSARFAKGPARVTFGGWTFDAIEVRYGTPTPAPVECPPFAAEGEPRPDATRRQGR